MIVPMQHLTILCLETDATKALEELRELGLLHVTGAPTSSEDIAEENEAVREAEIALHTLKLAHPESPVAETDMPHNLVKMVNELLQRKHDAEEQLAQCHQQKHIIEPFGQFDPDKLEDLNRQGVFVKLLRTNDPAELDIPENVLLHELSRTKLGVFLAAISREEFDIAGSIAALPEKSLAEIQQEEAALQTEIRDIDCELRELASHSESLEYELLQRKEKREFSQTIASLQEHGPLASLTGFCPVKKVQHISKAATEHGWAILTRDPLPDEEVPTLLTMPAWVRPIKAVMQMLAILPGYREADISGVFLIFFSIFFAILIGDAGYGMLFLAITLLARYKMPKAPAYPFMLFGILSVGTIIWGSLTGNWFGIRPESLPGLLRIPYLDMFKGEEAQDIVIRLCFIIGAVHLTIAHVWNAIALAPSVKALAQIGWIGLVWSMFFTALNMVLGQELPGFFVPMLIISVSLILLFMTAPKDLKKEWINHAMFPLSIVNCFVDIVSYIRLFAVGLASLSVAASFNDMAMQIGISKIWTIPIFAAILLLGHGLNIVLCALGILVHGVRLNTLEFSLHKNVEWKGFAYRPFSRMAKE